MSPFISILSIFYRTFRVLSFLLMGQFWWKTSRLRPFQRRFYAILLAMSITSRVAWPPPCRQTQRVSPHGSGLPTLRRYHRTADCGPVQQPFLPKISGFKNSNHRSTKLYFEGKNLSLALKLGKSANYGWVQANIIQVPRSYCLR
jgi:hypothetical protein